MTGLPVAPDWVTPRAAPRTREALKAQGVPRAEALLGKLKAGKVVELPDGTT